MFYSCKTSFHIHLVFKNSTTLSALMPGSQNDCCEIWKVNELTHVNVYNRGPPDRQRHQVPTQCSIKKKKIVPKCIYNFWNSFLKYVAISVTFPNCNFFSRFYSILCAQSHHPGQHMWNAMVIIMLLTCCMRSKYLNSFFSIYYFGCTRLANSFCWSYGLWI